jgi:hypothetical protein
MFKRKIFAPASSKPLMISSDPEAGPSVQISLVFRIALYQENHCPLGKICVCKKTLQQSMYSDT